MLHDREGKLPSKRIIKLAKKNGVDTVFYLCGIHLCWMTQIRDNDFDCKCVNCK